MGAWPTPYRTTTEEPTFQQLKDKNGNRAFPLNLDPFLPARDDMAKFAVEAREMGINYLGLCCGNSPHYIRSMAEALGRTVKASKYSPDMKKHAMLGEITKEHEKEFMKDWKDK